MAHLEDFFRSKSVLRRLLSARFQCSYYSLLLLLVLLVVFDSWSVLCSKVNDERLIYQTMVTIFAAPHLVEPGPIAALDVASEGLKHASNQTIY